MTGMGELDISPDGRYVATATTQRVLLLHDLVQGTRTEVTSHGTSVARVTFDPSGKQLISGDSSGVIRIGPITGEEPHLLFGHEGTIFGLAISPDGRTIASAGQDGTVRLWPMPEGQPIHTRPREAFLDWVRGQTNLRAVRDDDAPGGYRLEALPFSGWSALPPS